MLSDYINDYKKAMEANNEKEMRRIEKELASLGMDKMTLQMLAKEI